MDNRIIREEYAELAAKIIEEEPSLTDIANSKATIIYLGSDNPKTSKGKTVHAECEKVQDKNKWAIPCDYTITVFEQNCAGFSEDQMRILPAKRATCGNSEDTASFAETAPTRQLSQG